MTVSAPRRSGLGRRVVAMSLLPWALLACSCGKGSGSSKSKSSGGGSENSASQRTMPYREISRELRAQYPEATSFLLEFLEICNAGDYAGYRRLVGRAFAPESQQRFDRIYAALVAVKVDSIRRIELPQLPPPVYLVTSEVELDASQRVALRGARRKLAIVVYQEDGEWRMGPAPGAFQPPREEEAFAEADREAPAGSKPFYPWDVEDTP
jgi:hypothetical protein